MKKNIKRVKKTIKKKSFAVMLAENENYKIEDVEHKSKAFVPIRTDEGVSVEIVQVDGGLITDLSEREHVCDNLIYTIEDRNTGLDITWIVELKGTKNEKEAKEAVGQIVESIQYMHDQIKYPEAAKYITNRDYVFAAIAGAPDKTLPVLNNDHIKTLCRKLREKSRLRKNVKDMFLFFCYIKPDSRIKKAESRGIRPPYEIWCYHHQDGYISYPSMLMKIIEGKA